MMEKKNFIGPVNLGNPNEFTIKTLAEMIINITGSKSKIVSKKLPSDDPMQRKPDISLAQKELNWKPAIELQQGLKMTIPYFEKKLSQGQSL